MEDWGGYDWGSLKGKERGRNQGYYFRLYNSSRKFHTFENEILAASLK